MSGTGSRGEARVVELPQGPIHHCVDGDGPALVFVHGVFVNGNLWRKVVPHLSTNFRCYTPDWPLGSHRHPMALDADLSTPGLGKLVADFCAALDLERVTLVGNDTGGAVCQLVVTNHPERIERLVLTSCDAFEVFPPQPFGFLRRVPSIPGAAFGLAQSMRFSMTRRLPIGYGWVMTSLPEREVLDSYTQPLLDANIRRDAVKVLKGISPDHTLDAARRLRDFRGAVLLAWGGDDKLFPLTLGERLAAAFADARLEVVAGARTFVPEDQPEALAALIQDFCRE